MRKVILLLLLLILPLVCTGQVQLQGVGRSSTYNITNDVTTISAIIKDSLDANVRAKLNMTGNFYSYSGGYTYLYSPYIYFMGEFKSFGFLSEWYARIDSLALGLKIDTLRIDVDSLYTFEIPFTVWSQSLLSLDSSIDAPPLDEWYLDDDSLNYVTFLRTGFYNYGAGRSRVLEFHCGSKFTGSGANQTAMLRMKLTNLFLSSTTYDSASITATSAYGYELLDMDISALSAGIYWIDIEVKILTSPFDNDLLIKPNSITSRSKFLREAD